MNHLSDELLNKYIDNELDIHELNIVNEHIKTCDSCLARLKAQRIVEQNLRRIEAYEVPAGFTEMMMKQILSYKPVTEYFKPKKSYFLRFIFIFLGLCILSVMGLGLYEIYISSATFENPSWYSGISKYITSEFETYTRLFRNQTFTVIGGAFTFILLISIYFIYDAHRSFKNRVSSLR
jgi:hypothetical protein